MPAFKFELDQQVTIALSGETGTIIGRAEYSEAPIPSYYLRYVSKDGRAVEDWWRESTLIATLPCATCQGRGSYRPPYSATTEPCPDCAARPSSTASATTDASANPSGNNA